MAKKVKMILILSAFAFVVSACLQIATVAKWSVWHDEGYSAMLTEYSPVELVHRTSLDVHPPLYYIVLKAWSHIFGHTDTAMRSLSILFASLSLILSILFFKKLNGDKIKVVFYYIPVVMLSPVLLRYGQEMRMYTMAMFLLLVVAYSFVSYLQTRSRKWLAAYLLAAVSLLYTHYFVSISLIAPWIYLATIHKKPTDIVRVYKDWFVAHAVILILYLPWIPTVLDQIRSVSRGFWIGPVSTSSFFSTFSSFTIFRQEWMSWSLNRGYATLAIAIMILVVLSVRGALKSVKLTAKPSKSLAHKDSFKLLVLALWLVPMVLLFLGSSFLGKHFYYDRYFSSLSPFFYMTVIWYIYGLIQKKNKWGIVAYGGLVLTMCFGVYLASTNGSSYGHKNDDKFSMKQIVQDIVSDNNQNVLYVGSDLGVYFDLRFYLRSSDLPMPYLFTEYDLGRYGNTSLVYDRHDILTKDLSALGYENPQASSVWFIDHRYQDSKEYIPSNWVMTKQIINGYAKATLYVIE